VLLVISLLLGVSVVSADDPPPAGGDADAAALAAQAAADKAMSDAQAAQAKADSDAAAAQAAQAKTDQTMSDAQAAQAKADKESGGAQAAQKTADDKMAQANKESADAKTAQANADKESSDAKTARANADKESSAAQAAQAKADKETSDAQTAQAKADKESSAAQAAMSKAAKDRSDAKAAEAKADKATAAAKAAEAKAEQESNYDQADESQDASAKQEAMMWMIIAIVFAVSSIVAWFTLLFFVQKRNGFICVDKDKCIVGKWVYNEGQFEMKEISPGVFDFIEHHEDEETPGAHAPMKKEGKWYTGTLEHGMEDVPKPSMRIRALNRDKLVLNFMLEEGTWEGDEICVRIPAKQPAAPTASGKEATVVEVDPPADVPKVAADAVAAKAVPEEGKDKEVVSSEAPTRASTPPAEAADKETPLLSEHKENCRLRA
jgi:hypothetical protein